MATGMLDSGATEDGTKVEHLPHECMFDPEEIQRLGRARPAKFKSYWSEIGFCYSVIASQFMAEYFVSGFNVLLPTLIHDLDIPSSAAVWPSGAFALVTAAFLLPFGRLADMYGGFPVYIAGLAWFCLWSIVAGFSKNQLMLDFCRALQGLGPAAFLPSGIMLLGSVYRPGPRKNLVFSIYGGSAPLGFFFGIVIAGLAGSFLSFGWYFWIGAILVFSTFAAALPTVPSDFSRVARTTMDWLGSGLIVSGLVLVVFALTDGSHAPDGWATPYIYTMLIVGLILLAIAVYVEGWVAKNPLLPPDLFEIEYIKPLFVGLFWSYGTLGLYLLYATLYMQSIMGAVPIQIAAWYIPAGAGGVFLSIFGGYVMHIIPGTVLVGISQLGSILAALLLALAPEGANYWAFIFPSMCGLTIGIDLTFNAANVFISSNLPSDRQGLAGGLCNSLLYLGIAFLLSIGDTIQTYTAHQGLKASYQNVFWFQFACAVFAMILLVGFVRMKKAKSDLTVDERKAIEVEEDGATK